MKSKLAYTVLFSVFGIAVAAAAETAGVATSSAAYAVPFSAFIISFVLLTLGNDYGRSLPSLEISTQPTMLTPAEEAFGSVELISQRPAIRRQTSVRRSRRAVVRA